MATIQLDWLIAEELQKGTMIIKIKQEAKKEFPEVPSREIEEIIQEHMEAERKMIWCEKKGHKWVTHSYGGPESGGESGYCKKCGYSFSHTYY